MVTITISHDFPKVERALQQLHGAIRGPVLSSSINKVLEQARTEMARQIAAEYVVKVGYVRERLRIRRAYAKGALSIEGSLIGSGKRRSANIIAFVERVTSLAQARKRAKGGTRDQLYVRVKRGGPAKPLRGAFIGNKGRTVFERVGKDRLPIRPVQTIDVPQMFNTRRINEAVRKKMLAKFPEIFEREAAFYLRRFNAGGMR